MSFIKKLRLAAGRRLLLLCLLLTVGLIHIGQNLILRHQPIQVVLQIHHHQRDAPGHNQTGGDDHDGGNGKEAVIAQSLKPLTDKVSRVISLHNV